PNKWKQMPLDTGGRSAKLPKWRPCSPSFWNRPAAGMSRSFGFAIGRPPRFRHCARRGAIWPSRSRPPPAPGAPGVREKLPAAVGREDVAARGGSPAIEQTLEALDRQLERLDAAKGELAERRGRCRAQLEGWEEDREIAGLRAQEERRRAEAAALAEKYAVDR